MSKRPTSDRQLTRRQLARHERDARKQQIITWIAASVGVVVVGILAYGAISEIAGARRPVATVGNTAILAKDFRARQSYERWMTELEIYQYQTYLAQLNQTPPETETGEDGTETVIDDGTDSLIQQLQFTLTSLEQQLSPDFTNLFAGQVLDAMIEEELIRTESELRGIDASDDELQLGIERTLGYDRDAAAAALAAGETTTDTTATVPDQPTFDELWEQFETNVLKVTRFPDKQFRAMITAQVLAEKLSLALNADAETIQDQVELTVFTVETDEQGQDLRARINDGGEDPALIIEEFTQDENTVTYGYELPWLPQAYLASQFGQDVQKAAFNTAVGRASQPVAGTGDQVFVVYVTGHEERELSPDLLAQLGQEAYDQWLDAQKDEMVEYQDWEAAIVTE